VICRLAGLATPAAASPGTPPLTCDGQYDRYTRVQRMGEVADTINGLTVNGKPLAITPVAL